MKAYKVMINGNKIMTVGATSKAEARVKAEHQLDRPGRVGLLVAWQKAGSVVVEK